MRLRRLPGVLAGAVAAAMLAPSVANAAPMFRPSISVVARNLDNPRGVTVGYNGVLVVAEAGRGGRGPCAEAPEGEGDVCLGLSGGLTAVMPPSKRGSWWQRRIVSGLPSLAGPEGASAVGPHDVSPYGGGDYIATVGLGGTPRTRAGFGRTGRLLGTAVVVDVDARRPNLRFLADAAAFEARRDPDGNGADSNPYGVLGVRNGAVATDAGGNTLVHIDRTGEVSTLAVFAGRPATGPDGDRIRMQAVPTAVVRGPDGAFYVGQLTGFPFTAGAATIYRVVPGERPTVFARGFTNVIDLAFDREGRLLVLQFAKNGMLSGDDTGALFRVDRRGNRTELVPGRLTAPGGIAVGEDGSLFVTNRSTEAGRGELLRIWRA